MVTKHRIDSEQPPSPAEIAELVRRIQERNASGTDVREHGAVTVSDMSEATGASAELVRRHLERIRAEKALTIAPVKPKSQLPLLLLAAGLFATAYSVYRFTPHEVTQAELDQKLADIRAKRASQPKKIRYPIETKLTDVLPPRGFDIEIRGDLTTTKVRSPIEGPYLDVEHAQRQLTQALAAALSTAIQNEASAPKPDKPLPPRQGFGSMPSPDMFMASLGNVWLQVPKQVPAEVAPGEREKWITDTAGQLAKQVVQGAWNGQQSQIDQEANNRRSTFPNFPPGFGITFEGRRANSFTPNTFRVLPINSDKVVIKLRNALQQVMENDPRPLDYTTPEMRARDEKTPIPPWSKVTINTPFGAITFRVPTAPSKEYPTASDVMAGSGKIIDQQMEKLRGLLNEFNRTGEVHGLP